MATDYVRLMIPGPVGVEDEVLAAMAEPVRAHYGAAWIKIYIQDDGNQVTDQYYYLPCYTLT